jgi:predicted nucleic acid-binding protein
MHYLDTSILTAYFYPEARSAAVQGLLSRMERPTVSPLVEVELYCTVARKVRAGQIEASGALRIFSEYQLHVTDNRFAIVHVGTAEYALARQWLAQLATPLRVLDALHLAAAFSNGLTLVTADKDLAASARHFGVKHRLIS